MMELRDLTIQTAHIVVEAGRHALQDQINPHDLNNQIHANNDVRFASDIDERLVRYCRTKLEDSEPCDGFWEEKAGERKAGDRYWCLGPIDGAINYVRNMAEWTITLSLFEIDEKGNPRPVLGIVHAPVLGLTYMAAEGEGAIRVRRTAVGDKREKIMPSTTSSLSGSVISFGMSYFPLESERALKTVAQLAGRPADVKRVGPTSLDLCRVADGSYDAYFEPMLHSWDIPAVSAGAIVVWEAKGKLSQWNGEPVSWDHNNDLVASNGLLTEELYQYLR